MGQAADFDSTPGEVALVGRGVATDYALSVLRQLGWTTTRLPDGPDDPGPGDAWARSGAMALTGCATGPPLSVEAPVASCADGVARALVTVAEAVLGGTPEALDGAALLGERAALSDPPLCRSGATSPGGAAHLFACADGWIALNLARPEDEALLPAWLEATPPAGAAREAFVAESLADRARDPLVARGRMMGLAVAGLDDATGTKPFGDAAICRWRPLPGRRDAPLVVDLSSLWAGPLCGQLLARCGARVVKVESLERPDGARRGGAPFFDLLNGDKRSVAIPLTTGRGRRTLEALLRQADIVVESSRPRALRQLGIDAEAIVRDHRTTWVSITGYGRSGPAADWVAFGDDAAVSAGLVAWTRDGTPCFCGDALADPLGGLHAALAALSRWAAGGGELLDVSLAGVARNVRSFPARRGHDGAPPAPAPPRARPVRAAAAALGRDTRAVFADLGIRC